MNLNIIELPGCTTRPLANYLKAVAVLRLLSEQTDAIVAGSWNADRFRLHTTLDEDAIVDFFLNDYQPTPMIAPWNGGSGFYPKDKKDGIDAVRVSQAERFAKYRDAIEAGIELVGDAEKSPKNEEKNALLCQAAKLWRGPLADWMNAALLLDEEGSPNYPAILGTGGNDGRLDFTNNFMQRLDVLYDLASEDGNANRDSEAFLREALFGTPVSDLISVSIGQFSPGAAGGTNGGPGFVTKPQVNPFDFVLMLEGAIAFVPAMSRRLGSNNLPGASAPFAVHSAGAGYGTAVAEEKSRGEQWMPLWDRPTSFTEFKHVLSEARCRVGSHSAQRPRDVAQAIARCGVTRGLSGFERYAYLERNGQANLATPLGRWNIKGPVPFIDLLDDIRPWVDRLESAARNKNAPASWGRHSRRIDDAIMQCCQTGLATHWVTLLRELGRAEATLLHSGRATVNAGLQPLPRPIDCLSHRWIAAITQNGSTPEIRLAVALALQAGPKRHSTQRPTPDRFGDPIRRHFVPLETDNQDRVARSHRFAASDDALMKKNEHVVKGAVLIDELGELVRRRVLMARKSGNAARFPLIPLGWLRASLADLDLFINGQVDDDAIIEMARPLTTIATGVRSHELKQHSDALRSPAREEHDAAMGMSAYASIRLCHHYNKLSLKLLDPDRGTETERDYSVRLDPKITSLLGSGNVSAAVALAARRLSVSGLPVRVDECFETSSIAKRWLASLAWSLSDKSLNRLASSVVHRRAVDV